MAIFCGCIALPTSKTPLLSGVFFASIEERRCNKCNGCHHGLRVKLMTPLEPAAMKLMLVSANIDLFLEPSTGRF
jgi:hypothetical protein